MTFDDSRRTGNQQLNPTNLVKQPTDSDAVLEDMNCRSILTPDELDETFVVEYLGSRDAGGLWGVQHTRPVVDALVARAAAIADLSSNAASCLRAVTSLHVYRRTAGGQRSSPRYFTVPKDTIVYYRRPAFSFFPLRA